MTQSQNLRSKSPQKICFSPPSFPRNPRRVEALIQEDIFMFCRAQSYKFFHSVLHVNAQHRLRLNMLNKIHNLYNPETSSLYNTDHHQSSLLFLLSSLLQCAMPHTDYHVDMIPFPVVMCYAYFWFWLILNGKLEESIHL
jgi:hypothetical protein